MSYWINRPHLRDRPRIIVRIVIERSWKARKGKFLPRESLDRARSIPYDIRQCVCLLMYGKGIWQTRRGLMHVVISALLAVARSRDTGQLASQSQEEAVLTSAFPV